MLKSFKYAIDGLFHLIRFETNFQIHSIAALAVVFAGLFLQINSLEWMVITLTIAMVFAAEAFNSCVERLCNVIEPDHHPEIKVVKDVSAAAVLITALGAVVVAFLVFTPKIKTFLLTF